MQHVPSGQVVGTYRLLSKDVTFKNLGPAEIRKIVANGLQSFAGGFLNAGLNAAVNSSPIGQIAQLSGWSGIHIANPNACDHLYDWSYNIGGYTHTAAMIAAPARVAASLRCLHLILARFVIDGRVPVSTPRLRRHIWCWPATEKKPGSRAPPGSARR